VNEYKRARRFEDRTRWAPLCMISETDCRPVAYKLLDDRMKSVVREVHAVLTRLRIAK
jgi:hypothetical protein